MKRFKQKNVLQKIVVRAKGKVPYCYYQHLIKFNHIDEPLKETISINARASCDVTNYKNMREIQIPNA
ncbi:unnamed protein product [Acanthoscelides obtectus]|uniref:Uncharacterized protein n=1 Tax=Acanthoscelides obtectus TaxID=200917 RepID=A0A9P0KIP8_ACAOB|nr:unnamed protein product [Acanthoscelides obtectus]CAK1664724.1 hypothetical protein AOBTE_LOCUS24434 [Acanthoscelides obtectus]